MATRRLLILTAVALEARAVARAWGLQVPKPGKPVRTEQGGLTLEIHVIGIGAIRLPTDLNDSPMVGVIMAGLAGALDPSLAVGDVVIDDCPPEWLPEVPYRAGKIVASLTMVSTPEEKRELWEKSGALAVEMESEVARALANKLHVPFVSIRAISDTAVDFLDPAILRLVNEFGQVRPAAIAGTLLRRPRLLPGLKRLGTDANLAGSNLAAAVRALVRRIAP